VPVIERRLDGFSAFESSIPLPNTSPEHVPAARHGDRLRLHVHAQFAEVALHRKPRAARR